jgi:hypothetical protein
MVKLYNLSSIPTEVLLPVLKIAKRVSGCQGNVIVKVTRGGYYTQSRAILCSWVLKSFLSRRSHVKREYRNMGRELRKGRVYTDGGIVILSPRAKHDPLEFAMDLFETAIHEFVHIKDRQDRKSFEEYNKRWKNRSHERRAIAATQDAMDRIEKQALRKNKKDDAILNLAIAIEEMKK